jgi:hypothetical protein
MGGFNSGGLSLNTGGDIEFICVSSFLFGFHLFLLCFLVGFICVYSFLFGFI